MSALPAELAAWVDLLVQPGSAQAATEALLPTSPPPRLLPHPPGSMAGRVQIFDKDHRRLAGAAPPPGDEVLTHAIQWQGQVIGYASLNLRPAEGSADSAFLRQQYGRLGWALAITVLLALAAAVLIARGWSAPLRAVQAAARRMARGDFTAQLQPRGATEIAALMADMNVMGQTLASQENARRTWIAQVSHELRTPLSVLQGELESIEDGARQATPEVLASLREEVLKLGRLVNDLHTLALSDMGELHCVWCDGDAAELAQRCLRRFENQAARQGLRLELLVLDQPIAVRWDLGRIEQMLANLIDNSLSYTDAPGEVRLHCEASALGVRFVVEDSAPGVAPEQLHRLFEPLFRTEGARLRQRPGSAGSGLGLAIAQAIVKAHQGRITASLSPLGGLRMDIELPRQPA